ncbi:MAG: ATP-dependent zinc metalloprotease FtsH [Candidatus Aureabacteria bacterium]|nr:ATP-dependent zinc metalloprotease FtsH [Candidatus Auribacterota bacterium]
MKARWWQGSLLYLLILVALLALAFSFFPVNKGPKEVDFYAFIDSAQSGQINSIQQDGNTIIGLKDDKPVVKSSYTGGTKDLMDSLKDAGVKLGPDGMKFEVKTGGIDWGNLMLSFLPLVLFGALLFFLFRSARGANSQAFNFGKSRARLASGDKPTVTFADVAGIDESKGELQELVEFLKSPQKFLALGARIPRGLLLVGPPGCGKTLIAKATAGEAGVPFFSISGSEFVEMFVGVGASRVRDLFDQAKRNSPCIVFVDEIDAVGRHRGAGLGGGHDEREQTLNALLVEMDGFNTQEGVILIAATNRPDVLDPALLRPGRFDRQIVIELPDLRGREEILKVHVQGVPLDDHVELGVIGRGTPGFSGADLANLVNEAALLAARLDKKSVDMEDLEEARDKVRWGRERRSKVMDEKDKKITAYHEAGHALVLSTIEETEPLHKVTIIPRGMAYLGATMQLPEKDKYHHSKKELLGQIAGMMGGRVAEEIIFSDITSGAQSDIKQATKIAHMMVCEWGMSERLGPMTFGEREEHIFLGKEIARSADYSEKTAQEIDREVRLIIDECYQRAREIVLAHRDSLDRIAQALLEREVLDGKEITMLINGEQLPPLKRTPPPEVGSEKAVERKAQLKRDEKPIPIPGNERLRQPAV